jgi:SAM-dependent methyltransferase
MAEHSTAELFEFVRAWLPGPPARVLELGCGGGDLARAIAGPDLEVVAIDPEAPQGDLFQAVSLEEFADPGPFHAVIANRSLHHVGDLAAALDKIVSLLPPLGRLIVNEHACARLDEPTAHWYLEQRAMVGPAPPSLERCLSDWEEDHAVLHGYATMRPELDRRFRERFFAWGPYLHGELGGAVDAREEQALIDAGMIQATGFRYVGERTAGPAGAPEPL